MPGFTPVHDAEFGVLAEALSRQPLSPGKVAFAWRVAVGAGMARATEPALDAAGVLRVRAHNAQWRREVERARPLIAARLARLLGPGAVNSIDVHS
jgi:hypothetical protein